MNSRFKKYVDKITLEEELTRLRKRLHIRCSTRDLAEGKIHLAPVGDEWTCEARVKVAEEELVPVGLVRIRFINSGMNIDDLVVYSPYRRLGLGKAIINSLRADAEEAGAQAIIWGFEIEDGPFREAQEAFLSRVGFNVGRESAVMGLA